MLSSASSSGKGKFEKIPKQSTVESRPTGKGQRRVSEALLHIFLRRGMGSTNALSHLHMRKPAEDMEGPPGCLKWPALPRNDKNPR